MLLYHLSVRHTDKEHTNSNTITIHCEAYLPLRKIPVCRHILDGRHEQKTQSIYNHIQTAERLWDSTLGLPEKKNGYGLIDDCTRSRAGETQVNGVVLRHDDPRRNDKKLDCFRRASYLAKTNIKGNTPKGQRELFSSRIVSDNK